MPAAPDRPAAPRPAASVLLLRDGAAGLEVFVQRRADTMRFAPGMTVFPGGGVDARDAAAPGAWRGPGERWWARRLRVPAAAARALVVAAVREVFEETGVLLAVDPAGAAPALTGRVRRAHRDALEAKTADLGGLLAAEGLALAADLLRPWGNWVTPRWSPMRFDTFFFLAAAPAGQRPDGDTAESAGSRWAAPAELLAGWRAGRVGLMPPTWHQLTRLAEAPDVAAALALAEAPVARTTSDFLGEEFMDPFFAVADHMGHLRERALADRAGGRDAGDAPGAAGGDAPGERG